MLLRNVALSHVLVALLGCLLLCPTERAFAAPPDSSASLSHASAPDKAAQRQIRAHYLRMPLGFEANKGQFDSRVRFFCRGQAYQLFLTPKESVVVLREPVASAKSESPAEEMRGLPGRHSQKRSGSVRMAVLRMQLAGANPNASLAGEEMQEGTANYFLGNDPRKWRTNVSLFGKVRSRGVYPGIDLVYYGNQRQLEYDFVVKPGADVRRVQWICQGADRLELDKEGNLIIHIGSHKMVQHAPIAYQEKAGKRVPVAARFLLLGGNRVGFQVGGYDRNRNLVIDPVLDYSTYLGGSGTDTAWKIAVDGSGNNYIVGSTSSSDFPTTSGAVQTAKSGAMDAFVAKLNPTGTALVYATYLGGSANDFTFGVAVDASGNAYLGGTTTSTDFPTTTGAFRRTNAGSYDVYVAELNSTGTALIYSTYLGGSGYENSQGMGIIASGALAVDASGNAYVAGTTTSTNFPTTTGAYQTANHGSQDVFVTKLNTTGSALVYSTYLGGSGYEYPYGLAVDASGNAYVTGNTTSTNFPTTTGAFQTANAGGANNSDAFVTKLNATGTALVYSTYLGGSGDDYAEGLALDSSANAYVTGMTASTNFPTTAGTYQTSNTAASEAFVTKLNTAGTALVYSTYLGGSGGADAYGIAVDGSGDAYVTGTGSSTFPTTPGALQTPGNGLFLTKVNPTGVGLLYSTTLGGDGPDTASGIALDTSGNAYIAGWTYSANFPITSGAYRTTFTGTSGFSDAFAAKINLAALSSLSISPTSVVGGAGATGTVTLTGPAPFTGIDAALSSDTTSAASVPTSAHFNGGDTSATFPITTYSVAASTNVTVTAAWDGGSKTAGLTVTPNPAVSLVSLSVSPASVTGGTSSTGTVTLSGPAPAGGVVVSLSSGTTSAVTVPATVSFTAGQTTANFTATTFGVRSVTNVTLTAVYNGVSKTATLTVNPPVLTALSVSPTSVANGVNSTGTVTLSGPAPASGMSVSLSSGNTSAATVPTSVLVPGGSSSATFTVTTLSVTTSTTVTLTASLNSVNKTATLTITPCAPATVASVTLTPTSVTGGGTVAGTVNLSGPAMLGGQVITLSSSNPAALVPPEVMVPAGASSAPFTVTTLPLTTTTTGTITAAYHAGSAQSTLTVTAPAGGTLSLTPAAIARGFTLTTFASAFPNASQWGPFGVTVAPNGHVYAVDFGYHYFYDFPTDADGQVATSVPFYTPFPAPFGLVSVGDKVFMSTFGASQSEGNVQLISIDSNGFHAQTIVGSMGALLGIDNNRVSGHLFAANESPAEIDEVDPIAKTSTRFVTLPGTPDGLTVSADGSKVYVEAEDASYNNHIFGYDIRTKALVFDSGVVAGADGCALGSGPLSNKLYVNTNGVNGINGQVIEVDLNTGLKTVIATGGSRGDLVSTDPNGSLFVTQTDRICRLIPPPGSSFGATSQVISTRDDATNNYSPLTLTGTPATVYSSQFAAFDAIDVTGTVMAINMHRAGQTTWDQSSRLDLEWGLHSQDGTIPDTYALVQYSLNALGATSPYSVTWELPSSFYKDLQVQLNQLNQIYQVSLVDRISSLCSGSGLLVTDQPQQTRPGDKNILTFKTQPVGNPQIPQGRCLDITVPDAGTPLNGSWDIVLDGEVVASSGDPNGWSVEDDHTVYHGVWVAVPKDAAVEAGYEVRFVGQAAGLGHFDVIAAGSSRRAPSLLPIQFTVNPVAGGTNLTGTVTLDAPAPPGGAVVSLASASPATATVPGSATITAGQTSASFAITTQVVTAPYSVTIAASYNGYRWGNLLVVGGSGSVPGAPVLSAFGGDGQVTLTWLPVSGATGYNIRRSLTKGGPYTLLFSGESGTSYIDSLVTDGVTYYYVVSAYNAYGEGPNSNEAAATPLAGIVAAPTITPPGGTFTSSVSVTLSDATPGAFIHYTLDGTTPTLASPTYSAPLALTNFTSANSTVTVRATAFKTGYNPSAISSALFLIKPHNAATTLSCGDARSSDSLSSGSNPSIIRGNGFSANQYVLALTGGQTVTLTVSSSAVDPYLYLFDPHGQLVGSACGDGSGPPFTATLHYTVPTAGGGAYTLEVTSYKPNASGGYSLSAGCGNALASPVLTVTAGGLSVANNGAAVDFGRTSLGLPVVKTFTLTNSSSATVSLSVGPVSSTGPFTVLSQPTVTSLAPGGSTTFTAQFDASSLGAQTGAFVIANNDTHQANPFVVNVKGLVEPTIACGQSIPGTLVPSDQTSLARGTSYYADQYVFPATDGQQLTFTVTSPDFVTYPALIDSTGAVVSATVTTSGNNTTLTYTVPAGHGGLFTIEATSNVTFTTGNYTLTMTCAQSPTISVTVGAATLPNGGTLDFGNTAFQIPVSKTLTIKNVGTTTLTLGSPILQGDFTLATALGTTSLAPNATTTCVVRFNSSTGGPQQGTFVLPNNDPANNPYHVMLTANLTTPIVCGQEIDGSLLNTDTLSLLRANCYADRYAFTATAGQTVTISLDSDDFDTYLYLIDSNGQVVAENDNSNLSSNSEIVFTIPTAGTYTIEATSYAPRSEGNYTLTLECSTGSPPIMAVSVDGANVPSGGTIAISTRQGDPVTKNFVIQNTGGSDLGLTGFSANGDFSLVTYPVSPVPAGGSTTFVLRFNAGAGGTQNSVLSIGNSSATNPYLININTTVASTRLMSLAFSPNSVATGKPTQATVTLSAPAPVGGVTVSLSSSNTAVFNPTSITVQQGYTSATLAMNAGTTAGTATVTATLNTDTATATLTVTAAPPTVTITSPTEGAPFTAPANVTITATATAATGLTISKIEIFSNGQSKGSGASSPCSVTVNNVMAGSYSLTAVATDSNNKTTTSAPVTIVVSSPKAATPVISPSSGSSFPITVTITDATPNSVIYYTLDKTTPSDQSARYTGPLTVSQAMTVTAVAYATNCTPSDPASATYGTPSGGTLTATIAAPVDGAIITSPTAVNGTVTGTGATDATWKLDYQLTGGSDGSWVTIATGVATSGTIPFGTFDTTLLVNGQYTLRVTPYAGDGTVGTPATVTVTVEGNMKVGNFKLSFVDMTVPVAGIPIQVIRTYDSADKSGGDFGVGWRLSLSNIRLQKNGVIGTNWMKKSSNGGINVSYNATRPHVVTVTLPNGKVYNFVAVVYPNAGLGASSYGTVGYLPTTDTQNKATLDLVNVDNKVFIASTGGGNVQLQPLNGNTDPFDCNQFILTTRDGTQFFFNINENATPKGLQSITDRNGNTLTFRSDGIQSSSGPSITINRSGGYITSITDPNGKMLTYGQSNGDLARFTDRAGNTTTFGYDYRDNLTDIYDARGKHSVANTYGLDGRISTTQTPYGTVGYTHDLSASKETIIDGRGVATQMSYDGYGNVTQKIVDPAGLNVQTSAVFTPGDPNNPDKPISVTDGLQRTTTFTYSAEGDLLTTTDPMGFTSSYTYDGYGQVRTATDAMGIQTVANDYDNNNGNLLHSTDALGHTSSFNYNPDGTLAATKDAKGNVTSYTYELLNGVSDGRVSSITDANGHLTQFRYDADGNKTGQLTTRTNASGQRDTLLTQFEYDGDGRMTKTTSPDGSVSQNVYNSIGKVDHTVDAAGRVTSYLYNDAGNVAETDYPGGSRSTVQYDANGNRSSTTDRMGRITGFVYDSLNRPTVTQFYDTTGTTLLAFRSTAYDAAGQVTSETDENLHTVSYTYDQDGRKKTETDGANNVTLFDYDADGRQITSTDPLGHVTTYVYDNSGRQAGVEYPDGTQTSTGYDELGRRISETDGSDRTTIFAYNNIGQLVQVTDPGGHATTYTYDELGERISQTDPNGHTTTFAYDLKGHLAARMLPDAAASGKSDQFLYYPDGRLYQHKDFNGLITTLTYDSAGRLYQKTPSDGEPVVTFGYYADGKLQSQSRGNTTTSYTYDNRGRLQTAVTPNGTLTYGYDLAGNRTGLQSQSGTTTYGYDANNRLQTVVLPGTGGGTITYTYDRAGNRIRTTRPNGVTTLYGYDVNNRLTGVNNSVGGSFVYHLDGAGRRLSISDAGNNLLETYTYDAAGRLTGESGAAGTIGYTYDGAGNRLTKTYGGQNYTYHYDVDDRLTSISGGSNLTYGYDANGNLTTVNNTPTNTYDFENHLVSSGSSSYSYDGQGNRISQSASGTTTNYLVDTNTSYAEVIEEQSGGSTARYDFGLDRERVSRSSGVYYFIYDGLGSTRALTSTSGGLANSYAYDAYGNLTAAPSGTTYLFNGQQLDGTGLYFLRARYYDPQSGRFLSQDPYEGDTENPITLQRYLYAGDDPLTFADPTGQFLGSMVDLVMSFGIGDAADAGKGAQGFVAKRMMERTIWRVFTASVTTIAAALYVAGQVDFAAIALQVNHPLYTQYSAGVDFSKELLLYRGERPKRDSSGNLDPSDVFNNGMAPKGSNPDLLKHVQTNGAMSLYVSTTKKEQIAYEYATVNGTRPNGFIYEIATRRGIDTVLALGADHPHPYQEEVAVPFGIGPGEIRGAYPVSNYQRQQFIPNPNYIGGI